MIKKSYKMTKNRHCPEKGQCLLCCYRSRLKVYIETCCEDAVATGELVIGIVRVAIVG